MNEGSTYEMISCKKKTYKGLFINEFGYLIQTVEISDEDGYRFETETYAFSVGLGFEGLQKINTF